MATDLEKILYSSIAIGFFTATYIEGHRAGIGWNAARIAGLLGCLVWPLLLLVVLATRRKSR